MTTLETARDAGVIRTTRMRRYLMCPPTFFDVTYAINPWMQPGVQVDPHRAMEQWEELVSTYRSLGHDVTTIEAEPDLPDMVFAANGGLSVGGRAFAAKFKFEQRTAESIVYSTWLRKLGNDPVVEPIHTNEGEGDFLALGSMVLAGTGFRTSIEAHVEAEAAVDRPFVSLELVDPRFYHLDTCLAVLDDGNGDAPADIAYYPGAFSSHSRRTLRDLFPNALIVSEKDAMVFALNSVSDGYNVVIPGDASEFGDALHERGYNPVPVNLQELLKAGGSVKCCTLELHA